MVQYHVQCTQLCAARADSGAMQDIAAKRSIRPTKVRNGRSLSVDGNHSILDSITQQPHHRQPIYHTLLTSDRDIANLLQELDEDPPVEMEHYLSTPDFAEMSMMGYPPMSCQYDPYSQVQMSSFFDPDATLYPSTPLLERRPSSAFRQTRNWVAQHNTARAGHATSITHPIQHDAAPTAYAVEKQSGQKPTYDSSVAYSHLLWECLRQHDDKQRELKDIYDWFQKNTDRDYPAMEAQERGEKKAEEDARKGWQCSVRHNLSMNPAFKKVKGGKGKWQLEPKHYNLPVESTTRFRLNKNRSRTPDSASSRSTTAAKRQEAGRKGGEASRANLRRDHKMQTRLASSRRVEATPDRDLDFSSGSAYQTEQTQAGLPYYSTPPSSYDMSTSMTSYPPTFSASNASTFGTPATSMSGSPALTHASTPSHPMSRPYTPLQKMGMQGPNNTLAMQDLDMSYMNPFASFDPSTGMMNNTDIIYATGMENQYPNGFYDNNNNMGYPAFNHDYTSSPVTYPAPSQMQRHVTHTNAPSTPPPRLTRARHAHTPSTPSSLSRQVSQAPEALKVDPVLLSQSNKSNKSGGDDTVHVPVAERHEPTLAEDVHTRINTDMNFDDFSSFGMDLGGGGEHGCEGFEW